HSTVPVGTPALHPRAGRYPGGWMDRVAVEPTRRRRTVASRLLVVLCIGAAVWAGALAVGSPMWVAGVAAALVIAAALTRVRGRDVVSFVAAWLRFRSTGCAV